MFESCDKNIEKILKCYFNKKPFTDVLLTCAGKINAQNLKQSDGIGVVIDVLSIYFMDFEYDGSTILLIVNLITAMSMFKYIAQIIEDGVEINVLNEKITYLNYNIESLIEIHKKTEYHETTEKCKNTHAYLNIVLRYLSG